MTAKTAHPGIRALLAVAYVVMIATNALANALPINGRTTGGVSDSYPNLFAPTGITFAIWGVIYILLGAHVLYQMGLFRAPGGREPQAERAMLERVGVLFAASSFANAAWILAWHYDFIGLSTLLLATMLVLLIAITRILVRAELTLRERLLVRLPFSVYFGWLTVATIANTTVWLVSVGWDGLGIAESTWTVAILAVGALIGTAVILRDRDIAYGLVFVWAYLGIWLKHTADTGFAGAYPSVIITALTCIAVFVVAGAVALVPSRREALGRSGEPSPRPVG